MVERLIGNMIVVDFGEDQGLEKVEETQEEQLMKYSNNITDQSPCWPTKSPNTVYYLSAITGWFPLFSYRTSAQLTPYKTHIE